MNSCRGMSSCVVGVCTLAFARSQQQSDLPLEKTRTASSTTAVSLSDPLAPSSHSPTCTRTYRRSSPPLETRAEPTTYGRRRENEAGVVVFVVFGGRGREGGACNDERRRRRDERLRLIDSTLACPGLGSCAFLRLPLLGETRYKGHGRTERDRAGWGQPRTRDRPESSCCVLSAATDKRKKDVSSLF